MWPILVCGALHQLSLPSAQAAPQASNRAVQACRPADRCTVGRADGDADRPAHHDADGRADESADCFADVPPVRAALALPGADADATAHSGSYACSDVVSDAAAHRGSR